MIALVVLINPHCYLYVLAYKSLNFWSGAWFSRGPAICRSTPEIPLRGMDLAAHAPVLDGKLCRAVIWSGEADDVRRSAGGDSWDRKVLGDFMAPEAPLEGGRGRKGGGALWVFGGVWRCSVVLGGVRLCSAWSHGARWCSVVFGGVRRCWCSVVFGGVRWCWAVRRRAVCREADRPRARTSRAGRSFTFINAPLKTRLMRPPARAPSQDVLPEHLEIRGVHRNALVTFPGRFARLEDRHGRPSRSGSTSWLGGLAGSLN